MFGESVNPDVESSVVFCEAMLICQRFWEVGDGNEAAGKERLSLWAETPPIVAQAPVNFTVPKFASGKV